MSTPLHVLLNPDQYFEVDVGDGEADPSACRQLSQELSCSIFTGTAGSKDHQHMLRHTGLSLEVLVTVVALF